MKRRYDDLTRAGAPAVGGRHHTVGTGTNWHEKGARQSVVYSDVVK